MNEEITKTQVKFLVQKNGERNSEGYGLLALIIMAGVLAYNGVIEPDEFINIAKWCAVTYGVIRGGKKAAEALGKSE